jgi:hypothetical protein
MAVIRCCEACWYRRAAAELPCPPAAMISANVAPVMANGEGLLERYTGDLREALRPVAEVVVDCLGLGVEEAGALATSRGFHLSRISPTADGPYPTVWTFNLDPKRIVAIVDEGTVTEVHAG